MLERVPWMWCEAAIGVAACIATGAVLGVIRGLVQIMGERRG